MEKQDVIFARKILRKVTRKIKVFDKVTQAESTKEVHYPIAIEFDNSASLSEDADTLMWNDDDGFVAGVTNNAGQVRGSHYAIGRGSVINPACLMLIDYGEIQQFRVVADKEGIEKFIKACKDTGKFKVSRNNAEVNVDDNVTKQTIIRMFRNAIPVDKRKVSEEYVK